MGRGCPERLNGEFLRWVWNYPGRTRPGVLRLLVDEAQDKRVIHLRSARKVESFLRRLQGA